MAIMPKTLNMNSRRSRTQEQREHNDDPYRQFLRSQTWRNFRELMKLQIPMVCAVCGVHEDVMVLDHKRPVSGPDDPRALDADEVQWLCKVHDGEKTRRDMMEGTVRR